MAVKVYSYKANTIFSNRFLFHNLPASVRAPALPLFRGLFLFPRAAGLAAMPAWIFDVALNPLNPYRPDRIYRSDQIYRPRRLLWRMGLSFLYTSMVIRETTPPFSRFMGATAKTTSVVTLLMAGLMACPMSMMDSRGMP